MTRLAEARATTGFDVERVRADFPILHQQVHGHPLVYLDNANTTQKPEAVIDAMDHYYRADNANIHRSTHLLSERATRAYEAARARVQKLVNARESREVVFTRGCTEAINLVAHSWGRANLRPGDEVLLTWMEHHSNIVPWQLVCEQTGARLRVVPITDTGELVPGAFEEALNDRTGFVSVIHVSNALGTVNPVAAMTRMARERGIPVLLDGAQAVPHMRVDVRELGCDFYVFSAHKMYGPTGTGALVAREEVLEAMPPYQGGGDMIRSVTFARTTYNDIPARFEAGTPHIAGGIAFGEAVAYLENVGLAGVQAHEADLLAHAVGSMADVPGLRFIGTARERAGVVSFVFDDIHPHDVGTILDREGIAIRTGHHCAQPVMQRFGVPATARASFALYTTHAEVDRLVRGLHTVVSVMR